MRTETIDVLQFNELSAAAKEKARQWYREASAHDEWWDCTFDDAKSIGALMGITDIEIGFSGFWSQGDGAHFTGTFGYAKGCAKAVADWAPLDTELHAIARDWQALQARHFYRLNGTIVRTGHYQHSGCTGFEVFRGEDYADVDAESAVIDVMRAFMNWIYAQLEKQYSWQNADEQVDETILANEYEFLADGTRH